LLLSNLLVLLKLLLFDDPAMEPVPLPRLFLSLRSFQEISYYSRMEISFPPTVESSKDTAVILNVMKLSLLENRYPLPSKRNPSRRRIALSGELSYTSCVGCANGSDRICLVFSGSQVTKGRARVVIVNTGMQTEIGSIAKALDSKAERTETGFAKFWHKCKVLLGVAETTPLQMK
jgi:magnesium-transporting ATPase (P-type)